jgi:hypothetical protein
LAHAAKVFHKSIEKDRRRGIIPTAGPIFVPVRDTQEIFVGANRPRGTSLGPGEGDLPQFFLIVPPCMPRKMEKKAGQQ